MAGTIPNEAMLQAMRQAQAEMDQAIGRVRLGRDEDYWFGCLRAELSRHVAQLGGRARLCEVREDYHGRSDSLEWHLQVELQPQGPAQRPERRWLALRIPRECEIRFSVEQLRTLFEHEQASRQAEHLQRRIEAQRYMAQVQQYMLAEATAGVQLDVLCDYRTIGLNGFGLDPSRDYYAERQVAEARAETLLKENLSESQLAEYASGKSFTVRGSDTGKTYRINYGTSINIDELASDGTLAMRWCFQPQGAPSIGDTMLTQKIALECFESQALRQANRFPVEGGHAGGGVASLINDAYRELAAVTREAFSGREFWSGMQWRDEFATEAETPRVGHSLRIRLPNDYQITTETPAEAQGLRNERISRGLWQRFRASPRGERQRRRRQG